MTYSIASTERSVSQPTPRQRSTGGKPPNSPTSNVHSLAVLWARKYYTAVTNQDQDESVSSLAAADLKEIASLEGRQSTAEKMMQKLNFASAQAWSLTETLLSEEIRRHGINPELVNPLEIAADTRSLFQKTANAYAQRATPRRLSVIVGKDFGQVRQK
ncbi:MAG: hypothetical protein RLP02_13590, partial [Coleofasciculus sp. C2-GNP5-27]